MYGSFDSDPAIFTNREAWVLGAKARSFLSVLRSTALFTSTFSIVVKLDDRVPTALSVRPQLPQEQQRQFD